MLIYAVYRRLIQMRDVSRLLNRVGRSWSGIHLIVILLLCLVSQLVRFGRERVLLLGHSHSGRADGLLL